MRELWIMVAMICESVYRAAGHTRVSRQDFLPFAGAEPKPLTTSELVDKIKAAFPRGN